MHRELMARWRGRLFRLLVFEIFNLRRRRRARPDHVESPLPCFRTARRRIPAVVHTVIASGIEKETAVRLKFVAHWLSVHNINRNLPQMFWDQFVQARRVGMMLELVT